MPAKVMIDEEGGNKEDAGSKGEEGHHPPRAVTSRCDRPVKGGTPPDRREQIHREEGPRQEKPYACTKCKYRASTHGTCRNIQKDTERRKNSYAEKRKTHMFVC